jgi:hypothetical protein
MGSGNNSDIRGYSSASRVGLVPRFAKFKLQSLVEIVVRPLLLPNGAVAFACNGLQDGPITTSIILEIFKKERYFI